jgi:hypothetical protein
MYLDPAIVLPANGFQLERVVLPVVVGVDDLVGHPEREAVGGDEYGDSVRPKHSHRFRKQRLGVGNVLDRVDGKHGRKSVAGKRQVPHVRRNTRSGQGFEGFGLEIQPDHPAGRQQGVSVAGAAADVQHRSPGKELRCERITGGVPLPAGVEPSGGRDDALAGYPQYRLTVPAEGPSAA